jgi:FKBP12-rapamycin complex-associated protein
MEPLLKVLVPKLKEQEPNPGVVVSVLTAVGDLAEVSASSKFSKFLKLIKRITNIIDDVSFHFVVTSEGLIQTIRVYFAWKVNGNEMQQWVGELLPILLEMLGDASSPEKRGVALWALGQLVGSTGYVVKPYNQYPTLLDVLINFLKTEQQPLIRYNQSLKNLFFQNMYQSSSSLLSSHTEECGCLHSFITVEAKRDQKAQIDHL